MSRTSIGRSFYGNTHCSEENQGFLAPRYASPGIFIGIGMTFLNMLRPFESRPSVGGLAWSALPSRIGRITPHSQLRQVSFGCLVVLSRMSLPLRGNEHQYLACSDRNDEMPQLTMHSQRGLHSQHKPSRGSGYHCSWSLALRIV